MTRFRSVAGAAMGAALLGFAAAPAHALVVNGDFEDTTTLNPVGLRGNNLADLAGAPTANSWDVFTSISGWSTIAGNGIEVQTNNTLNTIDAQSGQHYVELDSHPNDGGSNTSMAQLLLNLDAGSYNLEFYYSPRDGDIGSNGIAYSVLEGVSNSLLLGDVTGPSATNGTSVGLWTLISANFMVGVDNTPVTLSFSATGTQNTLGGLIDNISVSAVPVPAALPLFLTAIAGLGFASRRRRRAA